MIENGSKVNLGVQNGSSMMSLERGQTLSGMSSKGESFTNMTGALI